MAVAGSNYVNSPVLVYDDNDNNLSRSHVVEYDSNSKRIRLEQTPPSLEDGDACKLLILTEPSPREYQGRVRNDLTGKFIALYRGREKENRKAARYKVDIEATIDYMVYEGRAFALHTPLKIRVTDISVGGMRASAPPNALLDGDRFQTSVGIKDEKKLLIAEVVYHLDHESKNSEYGCRFLIASSSEV